MPEASAVWITGFCAKAKPFVTDAGCVLQMSCVAFPAAFASGTSADVNAAIVTREATNAKTRFGKKGKREHHDVNFVLTEFTLHPHKFTPLKRGGS